MKKFIPTISLIILTLLLFGQRNEQTLFQTNYEIYHQSFSEKHKITAPYQSSIISDGRKSLQLFNQNTENSIRKDSAITIHNSGTTKEICTYDASGNLLNSNWKQLLNGNWINELLVSYSYDENGNTLTYSEQSWDYNNNVWISEKLLTYTYDINNNIITTLSQYNNGQSFVNDKFYTYTYDFENKMLTYQIQKWMNDEWKNYQLKTYTYNNDNDTLTFLNQNWANETWLNYGITTYSYDSDRNLLTEFYQYWHNNSWEDVYLYTNTYDSSGNLKTYLQQYYEDDLWINQLYNTYSYDENGNKVSELWQEWATNDWENWIKITYTYDNNGNNLAILYQGWSSDEIWKNSYHSEYTYDISNNCVMEIHKDWVNDEWLFDYKLEYEFLQGKINALVYEWDGEGWTESAQSEVINIYMDGAIIFAYWVSNLELFYSDITGIQEPFEKLKKSPLVLYPNPAKEQLTIEINNNAGNYKLELFNQTGQMVKSLDCSSNSNSTMNLSVGDMPPGLYFLKATDGNQTFSRKIIISR